ncbi:MAG: hypothetical protein IJK83_05100 [Clostridiales bacterium]|nr:hypothetical protein [Clostridiales bacterium]
MKGSSYKAYCLSAVAGVILLSAYPLYMGIKVISKMHEDGFVPYAEYPKYIIPYTPIALAVIFGVIIMPLLQKFMRKLDLLAGSVLSLGVFYLAERFMETGILVKADTFVSLESWQMSLCYVAPEEYQTRTWEAVDVLLGGYSPYFKIHFYLISVVIIISLLNCLYGFAKMILTGNYKRKRALIMQAAASVSFLLMCIWACFTAFYRTGELIVRPVSAVLMAVFFALLGITVGIFAGSLTQGKRAALSIVLPSAIAMLVTIAMYIGEMILLNGNLYVLGMGFFFQRLPKMAFAPADILIIIVSGVATALICKMLNKHKQKLSGS